MDRQNFDSNSHLNISYRQQLLFPKKNILFYVLWLFQYRCNLTTNFCHWILSFDQNSSYLDLISKVLNWISIFLS
jgi:hypothetical protein